MTTTKVIEFPVPIDDLRTRSQDPFVKDMANDLLVCLWLEVANAYIENLRLDSTKPGYNASMAFVVQQLVESMSHSSTRERILAINSPFRSEKFGNYSYTIKSGVDLQNESRDDISQSLTPIAAAILDLYRRNSGKFRTGSITVFKQELSDAGIDLDTALGF